MSQTAIAGETGQSAGNSRGNPTGSYRHPADRPVQARKRDDAMPRLRNPVRLKSGPEAVAEKIAAQRAAERAAGHPPPFKLPSGASILACGPVTISTHGTTAPATGTPQQPNLSQ
tara:strand:+ start:149 stop:493 length:345 start_codon:yes stop_codon:yes gene_type:complete